MTDPATAPPPGPVATEMRRRLEASLAPTMLMLCDESELHRGHAGHDDRGESHFRLEIDSAAFAGQSRVARQRLVYTALGDLMTDRVHALTIRARAPGEA
ncbi:MAG: BolA family transcriptional regulator [Pseudomonadota bacterium]|nr:BolA family transcriptional regulator [Pseudomonadota bacterium]